MRPKVQIAVQQEARLLAQIVVAGMKGELRVRHRVDAVARFAAERYPDGPAVVQRQEFQALDAFGLEVGIGEIGVILVPALRQDEVVLAVGFGERRQKRDEHREDARKAEYSTQNHYTPHRPP